MGLAQINLRAFMTQIRALSMRRGSVVQNRLSRRVM
jgi:hypothetical protein